MKRGIYCIILKPGLKINSDFNKKNVFSQRFKRGITCLLAESVWL